MASKSNNRNPVQVNPEFHNRLLDLQNEIRKLKGKKVTLTDLTFKIISFPEFNEIEKKLLRGDIDLDINLKWDKRK